jgi:hypothetical protein
MKARAVRPPWLLVLAVLLAHLGLRDAASRLDGGWRQDDAPPKRMQVAFVREMKAVVLAPARRVAAPAPRTAQLAGTTPEPQAVPKPPEKIEPAAPVELPDTTLAPLPPVVSNGEAEVGPEWPLSTRLNFSLTGNYRGPVYGQAQVEWLRQGADYQMHLDVAIGPSFAPLMTRRMSSVGRLTPEGISPRRYDEETKVVLADARRATIEFSNGYVILANNVAQPALPGAQDAASQFVQLTWRFLTGRLVAAPGLVIDQPLVLARRQYPWRYEVLGEEAVETPMGTFSAWHLRPSWDAAGGDLSAEVWLAPALQYLPVRLRIRQDAQTWIDLLLKNLPLQAAPDPTDPITPKPRRVP